MAGTLFRHRTRCLEIGRSLSNVAFEGSVSEEAAV